MVRFVERPDEVARFAQKCMGDASFEAPYLVCLAYRKKYDDPRSKLRNAWFKKKLVVNAAELPGILATFEAPEAYYDRASGEPYPATALVLYASIERSRRRLATKELVKTLIEEEFASNVEAVFLSKMMKHTEKRYIHLDVDDKAVYQALMAYLDEHDYPVAFAVETRNGYHVAIAAALSKDMGKRLHAHTLTYGYTGEGRANEDKVVSYAKGCSGVPIPGTVQNGFVVRMARG